MKRFPLLQRPLTSMSMFTKITAKKTNFVLFSSPLQQVVTHFGCNNTKCTVVKAK